jgi:hypothetical protein
VRESAPKYGPDKRRPDTRNQKLSGPRAIERGDSQGTGELAPAHEVTPRSPETESHASPNCRETLNPKINGMAIAWRVIREAPGFPYRHPGQIVSNTTSHNPAWSKTKAARFMWSRSQHQFDPLFCSQLFRIHFPLLSVQAG